MLSLLRGKKIEGENRGNRQDGNAVVGGISSLASSFVSSSLQLICRKTVLMRQTMLKFGYLFASQ